jgi:recombination DNA repair RAD52 pathway protein
MLKRISISRYLLENETNGADHRSLTKSPNKKHTSKNDNSHSEKTSGADKHKQKKNMNNREPTNDYQEKLKKDEQERLGTHLQSNLLMFQRTIRQEIVRILTPDVVGNVKDKPSHIVHLRLHQW